MPAAEITALDSYGLQLSRIIAMLDKVQPPELQATLKREHEKLCEIHVKAVEEQAAEKPAATARTPRCREVAYVMGRPNAAEQMKVGVN